MGGLPHYKNSKAAMNLYEPVYLNLFEVTIVPPKAVSSWGELVIENIRSIKGLEVDKVPDAAVEQIYKGAKRRFAASLPDSTTVDISITFEVNLNENNSMYVYKALKEWCDLIFDPLTGAMTLKKDYVGGPLTVSIYNRVGDIFRQMVFPNVWPKSNIPPLDLDYSDGKAIYTINDFQFAADYWENIII
mgnify:CR=1 FL=1